MGLRKIGKAAALDKVAWKDFLINGGIFLLAALATYISNNIGTLNLGEFSAIIAAGVAIAIKYIQEWIKKLQDSRINPNPKPIDPDFDVITK